MLSNQNNSNVVQSLKQRPVLLFALAAFLLTVLFFAFNAWNYPLFDVDEPRYAETAREMLAQPGDWITPHFNFAKRFDKPALFYWLIAGSYKLFGVSAFSARLVSACAAAAIALMLYAVLRRRINHKAGLITALVFATMAEVFVLARFSITDMTLACFMAGTWLCLFLALTDSARWLVAAGLFAGLGMLTKGPVALALPGLTYLLFMGWRCRDQWPQIFSRWTLLGLGLFLATTLPWYWAVAQANPGEFFEKFFLLHNVDRFLHTVSGHKGPLYYFIPVVLLGGIPWILTVPDLIRCWMRRLPETRVDAIHEYGLVWFWVVFIFFSVSGTKLLTYVLPGFPALAIILAWYWYGPQRDQRFFKLNFPLFAGLGALLVGFLGYTLLHPYGLIPKALFILYTPLYTQGAVLVLGIVWGLFCLYCARNQFSKAFYTLSGGMAVAYLVIALLILPEAATMLQSDVVHFSQTAQQSHAVLATYKTKKPALVFYTQNRVYYIPDAKQDPPQFKKALTHLQTLKAPLFVVIKNKELTGLTATMPFRLIQSGHVYSLVQVTPHVHHPAALAPDDPFEESLLHQ